MKKYWILTLLLPTLIAFKVVAVGECGEEGCVNTTFTPCSDNCIFPNCGCTMVETSHGGAPLPTNCDDAAAAAEDEKCVKTVPAESENPSQVEYATEDFRCLAGCDCDMGDSCGSTNSGPTFEQVAECYNDECE